MYLLFRDNLMGFSLTILFVFQRPYYLFFRNNPTFSVRIILFCSQTLIQFSETILFVCQIQSNFFKDKTVLFTEIIMIIFPRQAFVLQSQSFLFFYRDSPNYFSVRIQIIFWRQSKLFFRDNPNYFLETIQIIFQRQSKLFFRDNPNYFSETIQIIFQ